MLGARLLVAVVSLLFAPSLLLPSQGDELAAQSRRGKDLMAVLDNLSVIARRWYEEDHPGCKATPVGSGQQAVGSASGSS